MKGSNLLVAAVCTLILAACTQEGETSEEIAVTTGLILKDMVEEEVEEILPKHSGYIGDATWEDERMLLAEYRNFEMQKEYRNEFYVENVGVETVYRISNVGEEQLEWAISSPGGSVWNEGMLAPGQSKTYLSLYEETHMPMGLYTFSITSSGSKDNVFDFVFSAPE